jgi:hypothetical protein
LIICVGKIATNGHRLLRASDAAADPTARLLQSSGNAVEVALDD